MRKWHVQINIEGKMNHIGFFNDEIEASNAFLFHQKKRDIGNG